MNDLALVLGFRLIYNLDMYMLCSHRGFGPHIDLKYAYELILCVAVRLSGCYLWRYMISFTAMYGANLTDGWFFFQSLSRSYKLYWWLSTYFKNDFFSAPRDEYINNEVMWIKMVLFAIEINLHKIRAYDTSV